MKVCEVELLAFSIQYNLFIEIVKKSLDGVHSTDLWLMFFFCGLWYLSIKWYKKLNCVCVSEVQMSESSIKAATLSYFIIIEDFHAGNFKCKEKIIYWIKPTV